jgi:hypothetical protein
MISIRTVLQDNGGGGKGSTGYEKPDMGSSSVFWQNLKGKGRGRF